MSNSAPTIMQSGSTSSLSGQQTLSGSLVDVGINSEWNLIVVGAGTAGCMAAYTAAMNGMTKVLLIEQKRKEEIGNKICGDLISSKHLEFIQSLKINWDPQQIPITKVEFLQILSPDKTYCKRIPINGSLSLIPRHSFGQILISAVEKVGVSIRTELKVKKWKRILENIVIHCQSNLGESVVYSAPLVIDGSGFHSIFRKQPGGFDMLHQLKESEYYACYREILDLADCPPSWDRSIVFQFDNSITSGGYIWYFHEKKSNNARFNIGFGIPKCLSKDIHLKEQFNDKIISGLSILERLNFGGGLVPTRHPMASFVQDNLILTGDAGLLVNPLHGGGLASSLHSGFIAGKIASRCSMLQKFSAIDLWEFNSSIYDLYGKRYAILDFFRLILQNCTDEELNVALKEGYLPIEKLFYSKDYDNTCLLTDSLLAKWNLGNFQRWAQISEYYQAIQKMLGQYPDGPDKINAWAHDYEKIYDQCELSLKFQ